MIRTHFECEATWRAHQGSTHALAVTPEGRVVSAGGQPQNRALKLWDRTSGCLFTTDTDVLYGRDVLCVACLPGNRVICGIADGTLVVFNLEDGEPLQQLQAHEWEDEDNIIYGVAVLPPRLGDGVVSACGDGTLRFWDLSTGRCTKTQDRNGVRDSVGVICVVVIPDGNVVSVALDGTLKSCNIITGGEIRTFNESGGEIECLAVLSDGCVVSGGRDGHLKVWDLTRSSEEACVKDIVANDYEITYLTTLSDSRVVFCVFTLWSSALKFWDVAAGRCLQELRFENTGRINSVAALPDGRIIFGFTHWSQSTGGVAKVYFDFQRATEKKLAASVARQRACGDVAELVAKFI